MARVIVITSGKGGVGKTTTTSNIGMALAALGYNTLLVDCVDINRTNLILERSLSKIWECDDVKILFARIVELGTVL